MHGVAQQIGQHLAHARRIERQGHFAGNVALQASLGVGRAHFVKRLPAQGGEVARCGVDLQPQSEPRAGVLQQIRHHLVDGLDAAPGDLQHPGFGRRLLYAAEHLKA